MDGIKVSNFEKYKIIEVQFFSEDLKNAIKDELTKICHGEFALVEEFVQHGFNQTLQEFVRRIPTTENKKVGFVGELLLHIMIRYFTDNLVVSPFFNMEQKDPKKGFDIISKDPSGNLWFIESKSGQLDSKNNDVTSKIKERIIAAKSDLLQRLNIENSQLWLNAMNSVNSAMSSYDEKAALVSMLSKVSYTYKSNDKNVILGGIVFAPFSSYIDKNQVEGLLKKNKREK